MGRTDHSCGQIKQKGKLQAVLRSCALTFYASPAQVYSSFFSYGSRTAHASPKALLEL